MQPDRSRHDDRHQRHHPAQRPRCGPAFDPGFSRRAGVHGRDQARAVQHPHGAAETADSPTPPPRYRRADRLSRRGGRAARRGGRARCGSTLPRAGGERGGGRLPLVAGQSRARTADPRHPGGRDAGRPGGDQLRHIAPAPRMGPHVGDRAQRLHASPHRRLSRTTARLARRQRLRRRAPDHPMQRGAARRLPGSCITRRGALARVPPPRPPQPFRWRASSSPAARST